MKHLVMPYFVKETKAAKTPIAFLPGQFQFSVSGLLKEVSELERLGVRAILLFGIPGAKDLTGVGAASSRGIVQRAVAALKK